MPKNIAAWLSVNIEEPPRSLICQKCGDWYAKIDHLAPYHYEMCYCKKCGYAKDVKL